MPKLRETGIKKVYLPTYEDEPNEADRAWVEIEFPLRPSDFNKINVSGSEMMQSAAAVAIKVKNWNLTDNAGQPLPITPENIAQFDAVDFTFLTITLGLDKIVKMASQKKSNSPST